MESVRCIAGMFGGVGVDAKRALSGPESYEGTSIAGAFLGAVAEELRKESNMAVETEQQGRLFRDQEAAETAWSKEREKVHAAENRYKAADKALRVIAGFLASRRRWGFVSVRRIEAELQKAVRPLADAVRDPDPRRQKSAVERGRIADHEKRIIELEKRPHPGAKQ